MNPRSNPHRTSHYDHLFHDKSLDKIHYPVSIADIPAVEDQLHLNINVFTFFDDAGRARQPLYTSKKIFLDFIFLHYFDEHFAWITTFGAFMADCPTTQSSGAAHAWATSITKTVLRSKGSTARDLRTPTTSSCCAKPWKKVASKTFPLAPGLPSLSIPT